jgi:hypothetical protein
MKTQKTLTTTPISSAFGALAGVAAGRNALRAELRLLRCNGSCMHLSMQFHGPGTIGLGRLGTKLYVRQRFHSIGRSIRYHHR